MTTSVYRSGPKKGLPVYCTCGKILQYRRSHGHWFSSCDRCAIASTGRATQYVFRNLRTGEERTFPNSEWQLVREIEL